MSETAFAPTVAPKVDSSVETSAYSKVAWLLPGAFLAGVAAAAGIAFINSVGNVSGFVAPYMVGWIKDATGNANAALYVIAACMAAASLLVFRVPSRLVNK